MRHGDSVHSTKIRVISRVGTSNQDQLSYHARNRCSVRAQAPAPGWSVDLFSAPILSGMGRGSRFHAAPRIPL
jgi:hypothetical protein